MNDKIKNIVSFCVIILFMILMIVYGVRKNKKIDTNQEITDNSISIQEEIKDNSNISNEESSSENNKTEAEIKVKSTFDETAFNNGHLENHPETGTGYATLIIDKIKVNTSIFYGINEETITKGVAHDSNSYFSGENSSIIMYANKDLDFTSKLGELSNGDVIEVKTNYGDFYYKKYDEQIIIGTEKAELPIEEGREVLMIYTSYPLENSSTTEYRYVIYAEKL